MERIIIDTDPGIDDAMAILLAVSAPDKIKIEALTTVDGNTDIDHATQNASAILKLCGREDIPVYREGNLSGEKRKYVKVLMEIMDWGM